MTEFLRAIGDLLANGFTWAALGYALSTLEKYYDKRQTKKLLYLIAKKVGAEWDTPQEEFRKMARLSYKKLYSLSLKATKRQKRRMNVKAYLKKLGKTKLQTFLLATFVNMALLAGYLFNLQDVQSKVDAWMPMVNMGVQLVLTIVYQWVEGSIDKASIQKTGQEYTTGGTPDAEHTIDESTFV